MSLDFFTLKKTIMQISKSVLAVHAYLISYSGSVKIKYNPDIFLQLYMLL